MAKQGQHKNDSHDQTKSRGNTNPEKSMTITAGTPKKKETYDQQAREHKDTSPQAQAAKNEWNEDTRDKPSIDGSTRARDSDIGSGRSGSQSNAGRKSRGH